MKYLSYFVIFFTLLIFSDIVNASSDAITSRWTYSFLKSEGLNPVYVDKNNILFKVGESIYFINLYGNEEKFITIYQEHGYKVKLSKSELLDIIQIVNESHIIGKVKIISHDTDIIRLLSEVGFLTDKEHFKKYFKCILRELGLILNDLAYRIVRNDISKFLS